MAEQLVLHLGGESNRRLCSEVLRGDGECKPDYAQSDEQTYHSDDVARVTVRDTVVDYVGDHQGNEKLQKCFQQFEQRTEHAFLFVFLDVYKQLEQN